MKIFVRFFLMIAAATALASGTRDINLDQHTLSNLSPITIQEVTKLSSTLHYLGSFENCHVIGYIETAVAESSDGSPMMPWSQPVVWCVDRTQHPIDESDIVEALNTSVHIPSAAVVTVTEDRRLIVVHSN